MRDLLRRGISRARGGSLVRTGGVVLGLALASLLAAMPALAQRAALADRLPANTIVCFEWKGTDALSAAANQNHVLQLLADPEVAPAWQALISQVAANGKADAAIPPAVMVSLLSNPMLAGAIAGDKTSTEKAAAFLVYDASGKTQLVQAAMAMARARNKGKATFSTYEFGGTKIEVQTTGTDTSYRAQAGQYFLFTSGKRAIEELVTRYGSAAAPADSLKQVADYQQVQKYLGPDGAIQFFVRPSALTDMAANAKNAAQVTQALDSLHLARVHGAGWSLNFKGEATHARGVVFGNTAPGSPFDTIGPSSATFATAAIAGASSSFAASRFDWAATYRLILGVVSGAMPPQQAANLSAMEGMGQAFLGMPIEDALGLFSGEMARATSYAPDGTALVVTAIAIQKPNDVLRAVLAPLTLAEDSSGDTTFLDIAYPYKDAKTGMQRRKLYYIAVTPHMILAAPRKAMLTRAAQQISTASGASQGTLLSGPAYTQLRALLPEKLSGLMVTDWTQIPFNKLAGQAAEQLQAAIKQSGNPHPPDLSFLGTIKLDAVTRHLHTSVGGWWKDSNGVYFESYLQ